MQRLTFLITPLLGLLFLDCDFQNDKTRSITTHIQIDTSQYAIIKFNPSWKWTFKDAKPTSLTINEIDSIETILKKAVEEYNKDIKDSSFVIKPLVNYKRQFIPVINHKNQKEVWINCLCKVRGSKWKEEIISVQDGGNCYFNLKINLTTKTYHQFIVNGYA